MAEKDPNQMAAEKLNKETKKVQAEQAARLEEASEKVRQGKMQPPTNDDMGPLPKKNSKGAGLTRPYKKGGKITAANYDKEYGKIYRKAVKKMCRGGGIEVRGKTRGKMV